jgi:3-oxoacyl-[acyl-carrier protein] reductase
MTERVFEGRVALVTGGSRGIGRAICLALAREGARVAVNYRKDEAAAASACEAIRAEGGEAEAFRADVADESAVQAMVTGVESSLGPVDLLVTSAGVVRAEDHGRMRFEPWRRVLSTNVDGTYLPLMAVKDGMIARGYGRIVCVGSIAGLRPRPRMIAYSVSKAAVVALTRSCAAAFGPAVRVNCVAPGLVASDMTADMDESMREAMIDEAVIKRIGEPGDIADAVVFLLSERSSFITGQTLVADGGRVMLP